MPKTKRVHTGSTTVDLGRLVDQMRREGRVPRRVWRVCEEPSPGYPNVESNRYPRPDRGLVPALLSGIGLGVCLGLVPLDFVAAFAFARAGAFASGAPTLSFRVGYWHYWRCGSVDRLLGPWGGGSQKEIADCW